MTFDLEMNCSSTFDYTEDFELDFDALEVAEREDFAATETQSIEFETLIRDNRRTRGRTDEGANKKSAEYSRVLSPREFSGVCRVLF